MPSRWTRPLGWTLLATLAGVALLGAGLATEYRLEQQELIAKAAALTRGGSPERGRLAFRRYGCGGCHKVTGEVMASGQVGPPLDEIGVRAYLAGRLENRPDNMIRWIRHPRGVDSETAMPELGVSARDARDIAAYLYTLS